MKIFHLALAAAWEDAQAVGTYTVSTLGLDLAEVGFIHCSQAEQVDAVHAKFYGGVTGPVIPADDRHRSADVALGLDDVAEEPLPLPARLRAAQPRCCRRSRALHRVSIVLIAVRSFIAR
ncbi:DUF952 domain-containing protein [Aeromicrobium sp. UC242_57]|uniref:DUF952 domain-containing protein n=1 Tax=Aeromicrobium sp. UC242_57 TaxID=3374624 RepID=UPI0037A26808